MTRYQCLLIFLVRSLFYPYLFISQLDIGPILVLSGVTSLQFSCLFFLNADWSTFRYPFQDDVGTSFASDLSTGQYHVSFALIFLNHNLELRALVKAPFSPENFVGSQKSKLKRLTSITTSPHSPHGICFMEAGHVLTSLSSIEVTQVSMQ